jgi:hypothetical protein
MRREQWIQDRISELLPTTYFHIVFTLPQELRSLCMGNRKVMFNLLFEASTYTICKLTRDAKFLGATPGIVSILHTNGQDLCFHPHVHCIVTGGGVGTKGIWRKEKRSNGAFLLPRRAMEKIYKAYFLAQLKKLNAQNQLLVQNQAALDNTIQQVAVKKWNVYAKAPFGGPAQIIEYLGRYTHKVAITAHRINHISNTHITFKYKDYADGNKQKQLTLTHAEFLRRFEQHILPARFVKIRHSGFLCHNNKTKRLQAIAAQLQLPAPMPKVRMPIQALILARYGNDVAACPKCHTGTLVIVASYKTINNKIGNATLQHTRGSPNNLAQ